MQRFFPLHRLGATLLIGCSALLIIGLQPLLLGAAVDDGTLSMGGVGIVAMGEIAALGIGAATSSALLPIQHYRWIAAIATLLCAGLNLATANAQGDAGFMVLRSAAGLAEGVLVWVTSSVIVRVSMADRLAAAFMLLQALTQALMAGLLSALVLPRLGWPGGFLALAATSLGCVGLTLLLPERLIVLKARAAEKLPWSRSAILPLAIAFLHMSAISALWAYLEQIALGVGFDGPGARNLISAVLFTQFLGAIASICLIRKLDAMMTLQVGGAVLAVIAGGIVVLPAGAAWAFGSLCAVFGVIWLILMPFHVGLALRADNLGRVALHIPAAQLLGSAFGPLVASMVVTGEEAGRVPLVSLGFAAGAIILMMSGGRRRADPAGAGQ